MLCSSIHQETKMSQTTPIISGFKDHLKDLSLASCIQSLLTKNITEKVEKVRSLGFYNHLFSSSNTSTEMRGQSSIVLLDTYLHIFIHPTSRKSPLATPTFKARKEKKGASPSPFLVDPGSVQILGQVENSKCAEYVTTSKKKMIPAKETAKKKSSSKSSISISSTRKHTRCEVVREILKIRCHASGKDLPATYW